MPPLPTQRLDIPLGGGLSQKIRAELLDPGDGFITGTAVVHGKRGALQKPIGFSTLTTVASGGTLLSSSQLFGIGDEICMVASPSLSGAMPVPNPLPNSVFSYSNAATIWNPPGGKAGQPTVLPEAVITKRLSVGSGTVLDQAMTNGYLAVAYCSNQDTNVAIVDTNRWEVVSNQPASNTGTASFGNSRLCFVGNVLVNIASNAGATPIAYSLDTTSNPVGSWTNRGSLISVITSGQLDTLGFSTAFYYAFINTNPHVYKYNSSFSSTANWTNADTPTAIAIGGNPSDTIWVAYVVGQSIKVIGMDQFLNVVATVATVITANGTEAIKSLGVCSVGTGIGCVVAGVDNSGGVQTMYWSLFDNHSGVVRPQLGATNAKGSYFRMVPASKPFVVGGRPYVMASYQSSATVSTQRMTFCLDLSRQDTGVNTARPVVTLLPRLSVPPGNVIQSSPPVSASVIGNTALVLNSTIESGVVKGIELTTMDFQHWSNNRASTYQELVAFSGGVPSYYDGTGIAEQGFLVAPELSGASTSGVGSNFPANGSWQYVAVYRYVDHRGVLHQSAPSSPLKVTTGGSTVTQLNIATITSLQVTQRNNALDDSLNGFVDIYRTTNGAATYYLAASISWAFNVNSNLGAFVDTLTDASLVSNALLYTQPGTQGASLPRVCPPSLLASITHNGRIFGISGNDVWYSGQPVSGEAMWWSDAFQFPVIGGAGPLTALASMDGRLFVFRRNRIFVVDGQGPADNGSGNDLSTPSELPFEIGCIDQRSVVVTSEGIYFQSTRGLELIDRSLQLQPFAGQAVEDLIPSGYVVVGGIVDEASARVCFLVRASDSPSATSTMVIRDMVMGTWTVRNLSSSPRAVSLIGSSLGTTPVLSWLDESLTVHYEDPTTYLDGGGWVNSIFETAWIKLTGIQGFQRIRGILLTGMLPTLADLTIALAFDYSSSFAQVVTFTSGQLGSFSSYPLFMIRVMPGHQKCSAIKIRVSDNTPSVGSVGTGQGPVFLSIGLEYAVLPKLARLPAAQKA